MRRLRLIVLLARPAVVVLVGMFAAVGLAQAGRPNDGALLAKALVAVVGSLLFAVAVNDLADERIDRVNLPADTAPPARRRHRHARRDDHRRGRRPRWSRSARASCCTGRRR